MTNTTHPHIEHVVLLMLENRSFDNIHAWLYEDDQPKHNIPLLKPGERAFEGLQGLDLNSLANKHSLVGSVPPKRGVSGLTIPSHSPGEHFDQVQHQLYEFTPAEGSANDFSSITPCMTASMKGYMGDYIKVLQSADLDEEAIRFFAPKIMETHLPYQLPVLNGLAKHYAVCDHWFSSVPSQTNTNRAFAFTGTSEGMVNNGHRQKDSIPNALSDWLGMGIGDEHLMHKTLFNALDEAGIDWQVFWESSLTPPNIAKLLDIIKKALMALEEFTESESQDGGTTPNQLMDILRGALSSARHLSDEILKHNPNEDVQSLEALLTMVYDYMQSISDGSLESCHTYRIFRAIPNLIDNVAQHFAKLDQFHSKARAGELPAFTFIEPHWSLSHSANKILLGSGSEDSKLLSEGKVKEAIEAALLDIGNDYHPPSNQDKCENYVKSIYQSLTANPEAWEKTLFIITFDEPVGSYDHVPPQAITPPWGKGKPDFEAYKDKDLLQCGFEFDRTGGRVPTLLISPYVEQSTVFRSPTDVPYDHTSIIKSTLELFGLEHKIPEFGARTEQAPSFLSVLTRGCPRNDSDNVSFLQLQKHRCDPLHYYDRFYLRNDKGEYICHSEFESKSAALDIAYGASKAIAEEKANIHLTSEESDWLKELLSLKAHYPTLGDEDNRVVFYLQKSSDRVSNACVQPGDEVKIISTEDSVGIHNILGSWQDSSDCYYYNDILTGSGNDKQTWKVHSKERRLTFGSKLQFENKYYQQQLLSKDNGWWQGKWLDTDKADSDLQQNWTIEPITS